VATAEKMDAYHCRCARHARAASAQCRSWSATWRTAIIVGSTRYFKRRLRSTAGLEIGHTPGIAGRVQRTAINTECKLLLLGHAFEVLRCIAVEFRTHWFNQASRARDRAASARRQDGVLRNHHQLLADGKLSRHGGLQHHRKASGPRRSGT